MSPVGRQRPSRRTRTTGKATQDLLDAGASVTISNSAGPSARVTHTVAGLVGATIIDRLYRAALAPNIPRLGTIHPVLGVPVETIRAVFSGPHLENDADVTVTYGLVQGGGGFDNDPDDVNALPQIEILSTLQPVTTEFDVNGNTLVIDNYVEEDPDLEGPPEEQKQGGEVEVVIPMHTIIARRRERLSPGLDKAPNYSGRINSSTTFGDDRHMWLCSIGGTTDDGGDTWNVIYEFQRNFPDTWNKVIVWRDPETGLPGKDVTRPPTMTPGARGNGSLVVQVYPAVEFRGLNLPIFN